MRTTRLLLGMALGASLAAGPSQAAAPKAPTRCDAVKGDTLDRRAVTVGATSVRLRLLVQGDRDQRVSLCRDTAKGARLTRLSRIWTDGGTFTEFIADGGIAGDGGVVLQGVSLSDADPATTFWEAFSPRGVRTAMTRTEAGATGRQPLLMTDGGGYAYTTAAGELHGVDARGDQVLGAGPVSDVATSGDRVYWWNGSAAITATLSGRPLLAG
ncbi:MAG: hypothetical protein PGN13_05205 [Patulibacter minatonensis]